MKKSNPVPLGAEIKEASLATDHELGEKSSLNLLDFARRLEKVAEAVMVK